MSEDAVKLKPIADGIEKAIADWMKSRRCANIMGCQREDCVLGSDGPCRAYVEFIAAKVSEAAYAATRKRLSILTHHSLWLSIVDYRNDPKDQLLVDHIVREAQEIIGEVPTRPPVEPFVFTYCNWRGETATRWIDLRTARIWFGSTEWHPKPQMLMNALDLDKSQFRDFALADIIAPRAANTVPDRSHEERVSELLASNNALLERARKAEAERDALAAQIEARKSEIPEGIYYRADLDNFFQIRTKRGMGWPFYQKWRMRRQEFPQSHEAAL